MSRAACPRELQRLRAGIPASRLEDSSACVRLSVLYKIRLSMVHVKRLLRFAPAPAAIACAHGEDGRLGLACTAMRDSAPTCCTSSFILSTMALPFSGRKGAAPPLLTTQEGRQPPDSLGPPLQRIATMVQLSTMLTTASHSGHVLFALAALAPALWWRSPHRLELAEVARAERLVWGLLPPANAPPGSAGGSS